AIEPTKSRVVLAKLLARLNGEAKRRRVNELEAGYGMRDPRRTPVVDGNVDARDLRNAHGARLPMRSVVGLGPVVTVAYVVQRYFVALNVGPRFLSYVRLPVAIIGWRKRQPPCKHNTEKKNNCGYLAPQRPNECEYDRKSNCQEPSRNLVCVSERSVEPYGAERPGNSNHGRDKNEHRTRPANHSHQILHYRHNDSGTQQERRT